MSHFNMEEEIRRAKQSPENLENLIKTYLPFIYGAIADTVKGEPPDEYSTVAMIGFSKAVEQYDASKGKFLPYASLFIRRQVIDQLRKEGKTHREIPVEGEWNGLEEEWDDVTARRMEIQMLSRELQIYGITFEILSMTHPVHRDTRLVCQAIALEIVRNTEWMAYLKTNRKLPVKSLKQVGYPKKTLERYKKYIIAMVLMGQEKYGYLGEFVKGE